MKPLAKSLGAPALFGIVQGFVAASVYFAVGLVAAARARLHVARVPGRRRCCSRPWSLCYVEGASLHQERGGATVIARFAFNELVSFIAGWAICLDYLILIAICAFATTDYAAVFWPEPGVRARPSSCWRRRSSPSWRGGTRAARPRRATTAPC